MKTDAGMSLDMEELRAKIDRVDSDLLDLIAKRMELAQAVRRAKSGVNVWRPSREEAHVRDLAKKAGSISPALVSRIWAELTSASLTLQGPINLHIALVGDELSGRTLVRDRFGASIPVHAYPTASAALAAAHSDPEGVAVLPSPGVMDTWWTALGPKGAMSDMSILAALPRTGVGDWPIAVAVSKAQQLTSGSDRTLIYVQNSSNSDLVNTAQIFADVGLVAVQRSEMDGRVLYSVADFVQETDERFIEIASRLTHVKIIGVLPNPIPDHTKT